MCFDHCLAVLSSHHKKKILAPLEELTFKIRLLDKSSTDTWTPELKHTFFTDLGNNILTTYTNLEWIASGKVNVNDKKFYKITFQQNKDEMCDDSFDKEDETLC